MTKSLLIICILFSSINLFAQRSPDVDAKKTLHALSQHFQQAPSFVFDFDVVIDWPEGEDESWKGTYHQVDSTYLLSVPQYDLYCDGSSTWTADKSNEEILIQDYEGDLAPTDLFNPNAIFSLHVNESLDYTTTFHGEKDGLAIHEIEFKPLEPNTSYSKLKLQVNTKTLQPLEAWMINKDGSRYMLTIQALTIHDQPLEIDFSVDQYQNYFVEDLRF